MNSPQRLSLIAGAVAAALGSSSAFATLPTTTPTSTFYAAGGSAQANAFYVAACRLLTNVDVYSDNGTALSSDYYVIYGDDTANNFKTASGASAHIMYIYKFNGGSYTNGIATQLASAPITQPFPQVTPLLSGSTLVTGQTQGKACTNGGVPTYSYASTVALDTGDVPDFGLADVEVPMFSGFNNPTGNAGKAAQNTNGGAAPSVGQHDSIYDNLFGVAVTETVYTNATHPKTGFARWEVEGVLAGTISDWSQLYDDNGKQMAAGGIIFLDRGEGSGTKASGNEYFLGYPGDGASAQTPFSASAPYSCTTWTGTAALNCGGAVASLDIAEASTNAVIADLININQAGDRAIAILGLENPPGNATNLKAGALQYQFAKINGNAVDTGATGDNINAIGPATTSYINAVKGIYDFYFQNSFNQRTSPTAQATLNAGLFKTQMQSITFIGCSAGGAFPATLPGTLQDGDKVALGKGVTTASRFGVSSGPLQPAITAVAAGIPVCADSI
jgi:hypothetical protein